MLDASASGALIVHLKTPTICHFENFDFTFQTYSEKALLPQIPQYPTSPTPRAHAWPGPGLRGGQPRGPGPGQALSLGVGG